MGIISHMKLTQLRNFTAPIAPVPIDPPRDAYLSALLLPARRRRARLPRVAGLDFQDTQPSIRDSRSTPSFFVDAVNLPSLPEPAGPARRFSDALVFAIALAAAIGVAGLFGLLHLLRA